MMEKSNAIQTLKEMLFDRGYTLINEGKDYELVAEKYGDSSKRILCFFSQEDKLKIQEAKEKIFIMNREDVRRCIIVYNQDITPSAKKAFETIQEYQIELFSISELQFNITNHRLVPKHTVATELEKEELKKIVSKLPTILWGDVVRRYYDFKRGEIIRITRKDNTIMYRVVK